MMSAVICVVTPPPIDGDIAWIESSQSCGELPKHLLYCTFNSLSVHIIITKALYIFGGGGCALILLIHIHIMLCAKFNQRYKDTKI